MAMARVRRRVEARDHDVPEAVIPRRLRKSLVNFDRLFRPVASTRRLYDGSVLGGRSLIAHGGDPDRVVAEALGVVEEPDLVDVRHDADPELHRWSPYIPR